MKKILNIVLGALMAVTVALLAFAIISGGSEASVSINLIWGYVLLAAAVVTAIGGAVAGMVKSPAGIKKAILSVVLIVVVIGLAIAISMSHTGLTIPNSAGGVFDDRFELVLTESSIIVTYVAAAAAVLVSIYSVVRNALK